MMSIKVLVCSHTKCPKAIVIKSFAPHRASEQAHLLLVGENFGRWRQLALSASRPSVTRHVILLMCNLVLVSKCVWAAKGGEGLSFRCWAGEDLAGFELQETNAAAEGRSARDLGKALELAGVMPGPPALSINSSSPSCLPTPPAMPFLDRYRVSSLNSRLYSPVLHGVHSSLPLYTLQDASFQIPRKIPTSRRNTLRCGTRNQTIPCRWEIGGRL